MALVGIESYSNDRPTEPLEKQIPSRCLHCKRVANNKMYLDNYHLLANSTFTRGGLHDSTEWNGTEHRDDGNLFRSLRGVGR